MTPPLKLVSLILILLPVWSVAQYHLESGGAVVIEAESANLQFPLTFENSLSGYKGDGYARSQSEHLSSPGFRPVGYPVRIRNAGTYQFAFRSRIRAGDVNTAANSSFVRLLDESGSPVVPVSNNNTPIGTSWYNVHTDIPGTWSHNASNNAENPRSLAWNLDAGAIYTLEISAASQDHLLDRLILWEQGTHSFADTLTGESLLESALNELSTSPTGSGWTYDGDLTQPEDIYPLLDLVFTFQATNEIDGPRNQGIIGWKHATFYTGVMELYRATGDPYYLDYLTAISIANDWTMLVINNDLWRHADNHLMGETYTNLYIEGGEQDPIRVDHVTEIFDRMINEPWAGRRIYDWCDALFMSPPVWALLASLYQDDRYLEELDRLWWDATDYLYNSEWNLYYRDASYFNSTEANGLPTFWGRGNGWVMGGLVRILDYMRADWPGRSAYVDLFREMSGRIASLQMGSGGWPSSMLYPERFGFQTEMSATAFFVYALSWGINNGILDRAVYGPVVEKGWLEMGKYVTEEGGIQHIQVVGKEPGPVDDTLIEREYGYGAYILAGVEMANYYTSQSSGTWLGYPVIEQDGFLWANTGGFMGWVEVSNNPYVHVSDLNSWAYAPDAEPAGSTGNWLYIFP